jgi:hypothetical protein
LGKLLKGWNFGECSGIAVDRKDHVGVFNPAPHPVIEFDKDGDFRQSWGEGKVLSSHGIRVDPEGNVWGVDVGGHRVLKFRSEGKVLMGIGRSPGTNDSKDSFNQPAGIIFTPYLWPRLVDDVDRLFGLAFSFVAVGSDVGILARGAERLAACFGTNHDETNEALHTSRPQF